MANETVKLDWNHPWQKIVGPYFVVGTKVMRHWPDSRPGTICDGEKQYGPDFVDTYSTAKTECFACNGRGFLPCKVCNGSGRSQPRE